MEHCNLGTRQFRYKNRKFSNTAAERRSLAALKSFCKSKSITNQLHCNSGTWQFGYNYRSLYTISENWVRKTYAIIGILPLNVAQ